MAEAVSREEFQQLVARVRVLEDEGEGEKTVSRYILDQVRLNGDDIGAIKSRVGRIEGDIVLLKSSFSQFQKEFPRIVAEVMRDVLNERKGS